ncbi:undecaprenyl-diphosphate phosphatase [uncultured Campylobacter sp.]|uniref:undecaprenyl-diphosphate phosphatase n=1 Tax=uncultured Campylobacter sp. TaxID=218934 RepID=UPI00262C457F|nr:undecaprenyl-diphosphate phosphatase [uncultured Campylobacter sp.]
MQNFNAFILGVVEGLTEFLPISSTGHMILSANILGLNLQDDFWSSFIVVIQLGSILAVIFVFWQRLIKGLDIWLKICIGFIPTGCIGFLASFFVENLFNGYVVATMLILGGIVFIVIELYHKKKSHTINSLEEVSIKHAVCIGIIQCLAMIPGTSRSGASIVGGLLLGLNRKVATEFSFLIALPTMIVATAYSVYKNPDLFSNSNELLPLSIGFVTAFIIAFFVIKLFLKFISKFDFIPFAIYRIFLGFIFFYLYYSGILDSSSEF